ncbi:MAG: hypothetical protein JKY57_04810 [Kordiimonadaceae bacterium]|nr:hypothetical protein [Kordiimonadaceae bacterium]
MTNIFKNSLIDDRDAVTLNSWINQGIDDDCLTYLQTLDYDATAQKIETLLNRVEKTTDFYNSITQCSDTVCQEIYTKKIAALNAAIEQLADDCERYEFYLNHILKYPPAPVLQAELDALSEEDGEEAFDDFMFYEAQGIESRYSTLFSH